jgi:hypothetical protein
VPTETRFPLYRQDLLDSIISFIPFERAQVLLYRNGEFDPCLATLEVELHQNNVKSAGFYLGYIENDESVIETFEDKEKGEARMTELEKEFVIVNGLK